MKFMRCLWQTGLWTVFIDMDCYINPHTEMPECHDWFIRTVMQSKCDELMMGKSLYSNPQYITTLCWGFKLPPRQMGESVQQHVEPEQNQNFVKQRWKYGMYKMLTQFILAAFYEYDNSKTHQVRLGHVLVVRWEVCCSFPKAIVTGDFWWLSVLPVRSALWSPAEQVDGFTDTALNVNFCARKTTQNVELFSI